MVENKLEWTVSKKGLYVYGDPDHPEYAACTVEPRGKDFYVKYYGCDIHCSSTLDKAKLFAETYLSTPRNPTLAERYKREKAERDRRHAEVMALLRGRN